MPKILVIDDESDVLLIVKTTLEAEGFKCVTASNGPDGLEIAQTDKPNLILLDFMMPGMDGFAVLSELKNSDATALIPVIMLTGVSERSTIQQALASGIDYYIVKPFNIPDLLQKIRLALHLK